MEKKEDKVNRKAVFLEYKGYTALCTPNPKDRNRLYGMPCPPGHPDEPMENWPFAGDNRKDVEETFRCQVDDILKREKYKNKKLGVK